MSERMTEEALKTQEARFNGLPWAVQRDWWREEALRARASEAAKDKEIAALEAAVADYIAQRDSATERADKNNRRADALEGERDTLRDRVFELREQIERLKAGIESCEHALQDAQTDGSMWEAEAQRLRAQVATLIAGQQRNGEARQQARIDMAHEFAEMEPAARDTTIRRIIDSHEDKP